jgi:acetylornithine deacetylase/succinyl-diaminopimelate desuccinylase-like protein
MMSNNIEGLVGGYTGPGGKTIPLGHGAGAHAPDEYFVIDSIRPRVQGFDSAAYSFVQYLYELA